MPRVRPDHQLRQVWRRWRLERRSAELASGEHRAALRSSASGDDVVALTHLGGAAEACVELGDRLHGAAVLREIARCAARLGQPESWREAESAGWLFASLGELDLALESLLEAAEQAAGSNLPQEADRLVPRRADDCGRSRGREASGRVRRMDLADRRRGLEHWERHMRWRTRKDDGAAEDGAGDDPPLLRLMLAQDAQRRGTRVVLGRTSRRSPRRSRSPSLAPR